MGPFSLGFLDSTPKFYQGFGPFCIHFKNESSFGRNISSYAAFSRIHRTAVNNSGYIFHELPNPDAIWNSTLYKFDSGQEISLGRYMIHFYQKAVNYTIAPSIVVTMTLFFLVISAVLLIHMFDIRNSFLQYASGMILLASPHVQCLVTYYYCELYYALAFFFACFVVFLLLRSYRKKQYLITSDIVATILTMLTLATYQAYLSVILSTWFLLILLSAYRNPKGESVPHTIIKNSLNAAITIGIGCILYFISNHVICAHFGLSSAQDRSAMKKLIYSIPSNILSMYYYYKEYFIGHVLLNNNYDVMGIIPRYLINYFWILLVIVTIATMLFKARKRIILCTVFTIALVPFGSVLFALTSTIRSLDQVTGALMLPAMSLSYLCAIALLESVSANHKSWRFASCTCVVITLVMYFQMTIDGARYQSYRIDQMDTVATQLAGTIASQESLAPDTPIIITGKMENGNYPDRFNQNLKSSVQWLVQSYGPVWDDYYGSQEVWLHYLIEHKGISLYTVPTYETALKVINSSIYDQMPNYPAAGSTQLIKDELNNDILVIKLSSGFADQ